ncbi:MAG: Hsp20/alpha crystallin family protein [Chloroflexi bacterium]|jgi:HSP20 family protein|nr:Hsp20/alpha crystallin family protein [Chloroflexota bacterium]BCY19400.1 molecular chaperone [Leptolinea sp. HRD-7]
MANLVRFEPIREMVRMSDAMDRLFENFYGRGWRDNDLFDIPSVDMYQTENDIVVKASLPGMKAEDIQISVVGDVLTLRGEMKADEEVKEASYHIRERRSGSFSRSMPLPSAVQSDKAKAEFENGVLTLTLPKAEELRPKTITVKAK